MKFNFTNWWTFYTKRDKSFCFDLFSIFCDWGDFDPELRVTILGFEFQFRRGYKK